MNSEIKIEEQTFSWDQLTGDLKDIVVKIHAAGLTTNTQKLRRLFELGRPKIIFGPKFTYCRVHQDSVDVMKIITREYL